jgi:hypothetical protein
MKMRTGKFREMISTLKTLASRRLAGFPEESDVAQLVRFYEPRFQATGDALNKTQLNFVKTGDKAKLADPLGMQVAMAMAEEHLIAVPMPKRKLTKAHLPKEFEGADGEKNCAGRAEIMAGLGPLFDMGSEANKMEFTDVSAEEQELAAPPVVLELAAVGDQAERAD